LPWLFRKERKNGLIQESWSTQSCGFHDQSNTDRLVHIIHKVDYHILFYVFREIFETGRVFLRQDDFSNPGSTRCKKLLFDAPNGEDPPPESNFSAHGHISANRNAGEK
jgi:hypothetical protein